MFRDYMKEFPDAEYQTPELVVHKGYFYGYVVGNRFFIPDHLFNAFSEWYHEKNGVKDIEKAVDNLEISNTESYCTTEDDRWVSFRRTEAINNLLSEFKPAKRYCEFDLTIGDYRYECWENGCALSEVRISCTSVNEDPETVLLTAYQDERVIFQKQVNKSRDSLWCLREEFAGAN